MLEACGEGSPQTSFTPSRLLHLQATRTQARAVCMQKHEKYQFAHTLRTHGICFDFASPQLGTSGNAQQVASCPAHFPPQYGQRRPIKLLPHNFRTKVSRFSLSGCTIALLRPGGCRSYVLPAHSVLGVRSACLRSHIRCAGCGAFKEQFRTDELVLTRISCFP